MAIPSEALDESGVEHRVHYTAVGLHLLEDLRRPGDLVLVDAAVEQDAVGHLRGLHPALRHQLEELKALLEAARLGVALGERVVGDGVGNTTTLRHLVQQGPRLVHAVCGHAGGHTGVVGHAVDLGVALAHLLHEFQRELPVAGCRGIADHVAVVLARRVAAGPEALPEVPAARERLRLHGAEEEAAPDAPVLDLQAGVLHCEGVDAKALGVQLLRGAQLGGRAE
mmetsp:Transcript_110961/g.293067  ORF Transcript_110961/g.293067 Transcript_110961/m.293067 type:complete len:225 (+) Transcript_110961:857-1531(+)